MVNHLKPRLRISVTIWAGLYFGFSRSLKITLSISSAVSVPARTNSTTLSACPARLLPLVSPTGRGAGAECALHP